MIKNIINEIAAITKQETMNGDVHPPVFHEALPSVNAKRSEQRNVAIETNPITSNDRVRSVLYSR